MGVLYVLSFPILLTMLVVGAVKVREEKTEGENDKNCPQAGSPEGDNPECPAEPRLPWMLVRPPSPDLFLTYLQPTLIHMYMMHDVSQLPYLYF